MFVRLVALLAAGAAAPLAAQQAAPAKENDPIVVSGTREQKSGWREAEGDHVVVYSNGTERELVETTRDIERLHFLLSVLTGRLDKTDETVKLRLYLIGDAAEFDAMDLRNVRVQEGPYGPDFREPRYYDPREDGAVLAAGRLERTLLLRAGRSLDSLDPAVLSPAATPGVGGLGAATTGGLPPVSSVTFSGGGFVGGVNAESVILTPRPRILAGYARHFLLTYFPAAYPRWYVDGFAQLFSRIDTHVPGQIEYGRPIEGYAGIRERYRRFPVTGMLDGTYLSGDTKREYTPADAWLLTQYLTFAPARGGQLNAYLAKLKAGASPAEAAKVFGDLQQLEKDIAAYQGKGVFAYEKMAYPPDRIADPAVRTLTKGEAAFIKGRLELGSRTILPPAPPAGVDPRLARTMDHAREAAIRDQARWIAALRSDAARYPKNREAQALLTEAECRSGNFAECLAAADATLAIAPKDSAALAWKGTAAARLAAGDEAGLKAARRIIAQGNRIDPEAPLPLIAYYRSFDATAPDVAMAGLAKAVDRVPQAPLPRIELAEALAVRKLDRDARAVLLPVAGGPFDTPERARAEALLASLPAEQPKAP